MREFPQTTGGRPASAGRKPRLPPAGGFRLGWVLVAVGLLAGTGGYGQTFNLGPFDLTLQGTLEVGYDSNVDDAYPEEFNPKLSKDDFYWMPGLSLRSAPVPLRPSTTVTLNLGTAYMDYFKRNDLDTEVYNANLQFQTVHPRLTLSGGAGTELSVEANEDVYMPGGASYDPMQTDTANVMVDWNWKKLKLNGSALYESERHFFKKYEIGDQDETTLNAGAYLGPISLLSVFATWQNTETILVNLDQTTDETIYSAGADLRLFSWGGLYYLWEQTLTTVTPPGMETDKTEQTFGVSGAIPVNLLRRPKITYSLGYQYEEETDPEGNVTKTWEPVHTITVADEFQLSKTVLLSGSATWDNDVDANEVGFIYNVTLSQQIGARAEHALTFSQEPQETFGSNTDTETTTFGYNFNVKDLVFYNLSMNFAASYEESTPLGDTAALTEKTTTLTWGLTHTRQLTRKLSRIMAYTYDWENSNFHDYGAKEKHLVTYGFTYDF